MKMTGVVHDDSGDLKLRANNIMLIEVTLRVVVTSLGHLKTLTSSHPVKIRSAARKVLFCLMLEYKHLTRFA